MQPTKKSLGQHWLNDDDSLNAMLTAASVGSDDTVVEIGPGQGSLTRKLVERAGQVIAIELDHELAVKLPSLVPSPILQIIEGDVLKFDFSSLKPDYKLVANIPYYLTGHLLWILSSTSNQPLAAAILLQREVAERVAAQPGAMSIISVSVQLNFEASLGRVVPAKLFTPIPKVDSQILILKRRPAPLFPDIDGQQFFRLMKAGFAARRKTLLNSLAGGLLLPKDEVTIKLNRAGIKPQTRPQELSLRDWYKLYQAFMSSPKSSK